MPHSTYLPERMGSAVIEPAGAVEAGSYQSFTLTYRAGFFGIDDTGSIKSGAPLCQRHGPASVRQSRDAAQLRHRRGQQQAPCWTCEYDMKRNIRPWDKTLYIKVVRGFLREGDRIVVRFGDRRGGRPGMRVQTFLRGDLRVPRPGRRDRHLQLRRTAANSRKSPSSQARRPLEGRAADGAPAWAKPFQSAAQGRRPLGQPERPLPRGGCDPPAARQAGRSPACRRRSISSRADFRGPVGPAGRGAGDLVVGLLDARRRPSATSNPLRGRCSRPPLLRLLGRPARPVGGDHRHQLGPRLSSSSPATRPSSTSAATRATISRSPRRSGRHLNELYSREFERSTARFIVFPGYEWSGNTGLGGDRNVLYMAGGPADPSLVPRPGRRSSRRRQRRQLGRRLFQALRDEDCVVFAHIGGRYADIKMAHDVRLERSVEVHSAWGTFEWLLARRLRTGLPRRRPVQFRWPQGSPRRQRIPDRHEIRRLWRPVVPVGAGASIA